MDALALLDELRAMAQTGLNYAENHHDRERYERILELVETCYGEALDLPPNEVGERFADEIGQVTPKVAANAAVFDDEGQVLLMKRSDTGTWCLPGGHADVREVPAETAVREAREETGLDVEPRELVGIYRTPPSSRWPYHTVTTVYICEVTGGDLELSEEGDDLRYRPVEVVSGWLQGHESRARDARDAWRDKG